MSWGQGDSPTPSSPPGTNLSGFWHSSDHEFAPLSVQMGLTGWINQEVQRSMNSAGQTLLHRNLKTQPGELLKVFTRFQGQDIAVGVESTYNWYWLADFCEDRGVPFVLGHALAMKAIHGSKTKNDKQDSLKIAHLLRGGNFPTAYVYPRKMRSQRDLVRRRCYFTRQRAELQTHVRNTAAQHNLLLPSGQLRYHCNQEGVAESFPTEAARLTIAADLAMINALTQQITSLEKKLVEMARFDDPGTFFRLSNYNHYKFYT